MRVGNQQIDWKTIAWGWQRTAKKMASSKDNTWREIRFIERARGDACDLLLLLRSIWNRHAMDKRDKAYAVLGLYHGRLFVEPDYKLSIRQALVRISRAIIEETGSLDILHYAGMGHACEPLWGPKRKMEPLKSRDAFDDEQEFTGGWHLPSWTPDWGSVSNSKLQMRDINSLTKLEFPELHPKFRLDVQWNGENLIAAGIALGRLLEFKNPADELRPKVMIVPFPKCAFRGSSGGELSWPTWHSLCESLSICLPTKEPVKTSIAEFAFRVKMHDELKCSCSNAIDRPTKSISYFNDHEKYFQLRHPPKHNTSRPLDWVVIPFGARSPMILQPDCRIEPNPWISSQDNDDIHSLNRLHETAKLEDGCEVRGRRTFILMDVKDNCRKGNPVDELNTHREFTQELKRLGSLSCVYGDFEIR